MPPGQARRGSTHLSNQNIGFQPIGGMNLPSAANVPKAPEKHRIVQQGTWTPKGAPARIVFGAVSDAGCSLDGQRKTNQDSFIAAVPQQFGSAALFAVFDGHGEHGHLVSRQAMNEFGRIFFSEQQRHRDLRAATTAAYVEQERACGAATDCSQSGTTAVTCYLKVDSSTGTVACHAAWAGDSRAVLGCVRPDGSLGAFDLTVDQKPERPDEKARIESCGGTVEPVKDARGQPAGPPRVWYLAQVAPGLAMSRSIGDAVGAMVGVTAEPELHERILQPEDALLVIASDGVWEFLSSQQVVTILSDLLRGKPITEDAVLAASASLCDHARKLWLEEDQYVDDITCTVLVVQQAQQAERSQKGYREVPQAVQQLHQSSNGMPDSPDMNAVNKGRGARLSVSAIGPSGKRGAVSGESASQLQGKSGSAELKRTKKTGVQMELILRAISDPRHLIFQGMNEEARVLVAECMFQQQARGGEEVIKQGEQGDIVYVVESGHYEVFLEQSGDKAVARYQAGDSFGELALMYSCARAATVKCVQPGLLWGLDRISYRTIVKQTSDSMQSSLMQMLRSVNIFKPLDAHALSTLANSMQIVTCQPGHSLLSNVPLDALYILQSGMMTVAMQASAGTQTPGQTITVRPGGVFGESAVADTVQPSTLVTATATPAGACVLARITRESFNKHVGALQEIRDVSFNEKALSTVADLQALTIAERRQLARLMSRVTYEAGETLIKANSDISMLHIIVKGQVTIQGSSSIGVLGEGQVFGEGMLRHQRAASSYVTTPGKGPCVCMVVSRDTIQRSLGPLSSIIEREQEKAARRAHALSIAFGNLSQGQILGVGTFGVVRLVQDKKSKSTFALKSMRKQKVVDMGQVHVSTSTSKQADMHSFSHLSLLSPLPPTPTGRAHYRRV